MIIYFIKSLICLGVAYSLYRVFLAKHKSFLLNRLFLIISCVCCVLAPLIPFTSIASTTISPIINGIITDSSNTTYNHTPVHQISTEYAFSLFNLISVIYIVITMILAIKFLFSIYNVVQLAIKDPNSNFYGMRIIVIEDKNTPFSFFNRLFISNQTHQNGISNSILFHEYCHVKHFHSVDRLICEVIFVFQWWNPFFLLMRKEIIANHEYTADDFALNHSKSKDSYSIFLIKSMTCQKPHRFLQSGFSQLSISKRLSMIYSPSTTPNLLIVLLVVATFNMMLFSCTKENLNEQFHNTSDTEKITIQVNDLSGEYIYPLELVQKAKDIGFEAQNFLLEYRSPSEELFNKFSSSSQFEIQIDRKPINQSELQSFSNTDFVAFKVFDKSKLENSSYFRADLYTQKGYFTFADECFDRAIEFLNKH